MEPRQTDDGYRHLLKDVNIDRGPGVLIYIGPQSFSGFQPEFPYLHVNMAQPGLPGWQEVFT